MAEIGCTEEARGQVVVVVPDILDEAFGGGFSYGFGQHIELQRQYICRLGIRHEAAIGCRIFAEEGAFYLLEDIAVVCYIFGMAEYAGGVDHELGGMGEEALRYKVLVGVGGAFAIAAAVV